VTAAPFDGVRTTAFGQVLQRCGVQPRVACAGLAESQTWSVLPQRVGLALQRIGARHVHGPCSSGANEAGGRHARGHFDLLLRDGAFEFVSVAAVRQGRLV
jgi:hypothetical protein